MKIRRSYLTVGVTRYSSCLASIAMAAILAGCGNGTSESAATSEAAAQSLALSKHNRQCDRLESTFTRVLEVEGYGYPAGTIAGSSAGNGLALSEDGRYAAFVSGRPDLIDGESDVNGTSSDIFLYDLKKQRVERVTPGTNAASGPGGPPSWLINCPCSVSKHGDEVIFTSTVTDMIAGETDPNGAIRDVFLYKRRTGALQRVTPGTSRTNSYLMSDRSISANGHFIVLRGPEHLAGNGSVSDTPAILLYKHSSGQFTKIADAPSAFAVATISGDGRYVAYSSTSILGTTISDVYLYDRKSKQTTRLTPGISPGFVRPSIARRGRGIAFDGSPNNRLPGETSISDSNWDVFYATRRGRRDSAIKRIWAAVAADAWNGAPTISANGKVVAFGSRVSDFGGPLGPFDVLAYHRPSRQLIDLTPGLSYATGARFGQPLVSSNGHLIAFRGSAPPEGSGIYVAKLSRSCRKP